MRYQRTADLFVAPAGPCAITLRPYQEGAREAVHREHEAVRSTLVVLPTGTGKTALAGSLGLDVRAGGSRILFLAPTITLCDQTYESMRRMGLTVGVEQADREVVWPLPDVVVASVATMRGRRLATFPKDSFALIVVDEAHRAPGGSIYSAILEHFSGAKVVGLSATPDRTDGLAMANVFETVAYEMTMLAAIRDGWLAPLEFRTVRTEWDVKAIKEKAGEVDPISVAAELVRSGLLHDAARTLAELGGERKILAFLPTVNTSKAFCVELEEAGIVAAHVDGDTPPLERQRIYDGFRVGTIRALVNCAVLTEGFDQPDVSVVALLSPTKSRSRLTQMIGRGTRTAEGKANCLVLDFCPGRLKKGRLASPADALAGRMLPDEVHAQLAAEGNLEQAIERAELTAEQLRKAREEREEAAARRREQRERMRALVKRRRVDWSTEDHDAGSILGGPGQPSTRGAAGTTDGPSESEEERRRRLKLATPRQAKILARFGLNPDMPFFLARMAMDAIVAAGWKLPAHIKDDRRFYARPVRQQAAQVAE